MKGFDERCLCFKCKDDYETAGYRVERIKQIKDKDRCDKCGRYGWTYIVKHNQRSE